MKKLAMIIMICCFTVGCSTPNVTADNTSILSAVEMTSETVYADFEFNTVLCDQTGMVIRGDFIDNLSDLNIKSIEYQSDQISFVKVIPITIEQANDRDYVSTNEFIEVSYGQNDDGTTSEFATAIKLIGNRYTVSAANPSIHNFAVQIAQDKVDEGLNLDPQVINAKVTFENGNFIEQVLMVSGSYKQNNITFKLY